MHAAGAGTDYIGFIFAPSPRRVAIRQAATISAQLEDRFPGIGRVGVFVEPDQDELITTAASTGLTHVQIYGSLPKRRPESLPCIAAVRAGAPGEVRIPDGDPWAVLVEPRVAGKTGGTGRSFPWEWVEPLLSQTRVFVAGGLDAAAVAALLQVVTPFGVDASSGLERSPGVKDPEKVRAFIEAVRSTSTRRGEP
jgi:phosphoribosylanthranilate isomerase